MIGKINPSLRKSRSARKEGEIDGVWKDDFAEGLRRAVRAYCRNSGIVLRDARSKQKKKDVFEDGGWGKYLIPAPKRLLVLK